MQARERRILLDSWFDELAYKRAQGSFSAKVTFILRKLAEHDTAKLQTVLDDIYRGGPPDPQDITKFEWRTMLAYMGANEHEIWDIQQRMGRQWR